MTSPADHNHALALAGQLRAVTGKLRRRTREAIPIGELTWPQVTVLAHLDRGGPATVSVLARHEGMRPQSMGETVSALKAAGFVVGAPDPKDGRQTVLSLTDEGRAWLNARRAVGEDWLARAILSRLSADEQAQLAQAVAMLARLTDA